jgi:hypothetical protein
MEQGYRNAAGRIGEGTTAGHLPALRIEQVINLRAEQRFGPPGIEPIARTGLFI